MDYAGWTFLSIKILAEWFVSGGTNLSVKMPLSSGFGTTWGCVIIDKNVHVWVNYPFKTADMIFITKLISTN